MQELHFYSDDKYRGEGLSFGLVRGLLASFDDMNITQEGMGLGTLVMTIGGKTFFSRSCQSIVVDNNRIIKVFLLDTRMAWSISGYRSPFIAYFMRKMTDFYMLVKNKKLQQLCLRFGYHLRKALTIEPVFEESTPMAQVSFYYDLKGTSELSIECAVSSLCGDLEKVYILNELGARHFDKSYINEVVSDPPSGWQKISDYFSSFVFYCSKHNIKFFIKSLDVQAGIPANIFWGREVTKEHCWAGYGIELNCKNSNVKDLSVKYKLYVGD
ncbi:MAG: hypothetical protein DKM50_08555 [Candidatus Margulisiibacteriota bacterium]|nr:MAG: hypothetical protein A2X43_11890 [Candidatus Margulisbacteria bacterium GWD2_39_127]OGI01840.1 MAG: hypothetical protein A2X42_04415 [Candidatus Margulisbacteria bacterium GWF2_38_17]OGI10162.1 MAG: hypothetical protein A2X41_01135 [Candidatus Margulisbacteria bacterium GWE2_39_32]PZM79501.1 MAG: hypothetical protein DKM50_08555 [Candidatus Margulisiibacteriota bacterium]HAR63828.1 hypothetical protein [Candidatus Margulisiibacteriota bacterium]